MFLYLYERINNVDILSIKDGKIASAFRKFRVRTHYTKANKKNKIKGSDEK